MEPSTSSNDKMHVISPPKSQKKKRIMPTAIKSDAVEAQEVNVDGEAFDSPSSQRAGKRKNRAQITKDDIIMDSKVGAPPKRMKTNQSTQSNASSLAPFSFFITSPPSNYAALYGRLGDWFEGAVNGDFDPAQQKFEIGDEIRSSLSQAALADWEMVLDQIRDAEGHPERLDDLWTKLTIVDKIISLFDEDEWRSSNLHWQNLQHEVWWVQTANAWFDKPFTITTDDYMTMGLGSLILELWYRFIWARYTIAVHAKIVAEQLAASNSSPSGSIIDSQKDEDEILENSDLGEGAESESEAELSSDEMDDREIDIISPAPRPFFQSSPTSISSFQSPQRDKMSFRRVRDAHLTSSPIAIVKSSSNNSLVEDSVSLIANYGSAPSNAVADHNGSDDDFPDNVSLQVCASRADLDTLDTTDRDLDEEKATDALEGAADKDEQFLMEDDVDSAEMNDENEEPQHIKRSTTGPLVAEEEYEHHSVSEIPPAVSLFFPHPAARQAIDSIEALVLGKEGEWDIGKALDVFVDLVEHRNAESKLQNRNSGFVPQQQQYQSRKQIRAKLEHLYQTLYAPFLRNVGLRLCGDSGHIWKIQTNFEAFYDVFLVTTLGNLSQYGQAPAHNFRQLFPRLALSSDSRSQVYITQVCYQIHSTLQQKGKITPEIDGLISLLDQLIDERNAILKQMGTSEDDDNDGMDDSEEEEGSGVESRKLKRASITSVFGSQHALLMEKVAASRKNRLKEIEEMIESIKDEFNKHTGSIDKLPAKKQKKLANFEQKLAAASSSSSSSALPSPLVPHTQKPTATDQGTGEEEEADKNQEDEEMIESCLVGDFERQNIGKNAFGDEMT